MIPLAYILKGALKFEITLMLYLALYVVFFFNITIKKESFFVHIIDILFWLWAVVMLVGVIHSPNQIQGLFKTAKFIFLAYSLVFFSRFFIRREKDIEKIIYYLLYASVTTEYLVLLDFFLSGVETFRYQAFGTIVPIPLSMLGATTFAITLILFSFKKITGRYFLICMLPSIGMLGIAASKGPVISLIVAIVLLLPVLIEKMNIKTYFITILSIFFLVQVPFIANSIDTLINRFVRIENDMSTSIRFNIMNAGLESFFSHPLIGEGTAAFYPDTSHNIFIEIMSENGIILLIIFLIFIILGTISYFKFLLKKNKNPFETVIYSLLLISLVSLMFSYTYVDHKYFFLSIGLLLVFNERTEKLNGLG